MFSLKRLHGCGIITNYDCSATCAHCAYCSSPRWPKENMTQQTAEKLFRFLRNAGCVSVHIGGGEPLLRPEKLLPVLDAAASASIAIDYVETNASWHLDEARTGPLLHALRSHGVDTLLVSMDPFHNEHIPFRKVKDLIRVCHTHGMHVFPWKEEFFDELDLMGDRTTHALSEWNARFGDGCVTNLIRRYGLGLKGRDLETYRGSLPKGPLEDILRDAGPCRELAGTHHFHLDPDGNFIPQSCPGLSIHHLDLADGVTREQYPVVSRLFEEGIASLLAYAVETHEYVPAKRYANKCDICRDIRKHLVLGRNLILKDTQPRGHYLYA